MTEHLLPAGASWGVLAALLGQGGVDNGSGVWTLVYLGAFALVLIAAPPHLNSVPTDEPRGAE